MNWSYLSKITLLDFFMKFIIMGNVSSIFHIDSFKGHISNHNGHILVDTKGFDIRSNWIYLYMKAYNKYEVFEAILYLHIVIQLSSRLFVYIIHVQSIKYNIIRYSVILDVCINYMNYE